LNEKDWELYNSVEKGEENIEFFGLERSFPEIPEKGNMHNLSLSALEEK